MQNKTRPEKCQDYIKPSWGTYKVHVYMPRIRGEILMLSVKTSKWISVTLLVKYVYTSAAKLFLPSNVRKFNDLCNFFLKWPTFCLLDITYKVCLHFTINYIYINLMCLRKVWNDIYNMQFRIRFFFFYYQRLLILLPCIFKQGYQNWLLLKIQI